MTMVKSKKCSAMRKFITTMLIAAATFTACVQNDYVIVPNNNGKITFTAAIEAPETRTVLVGGGNDTYHAEWAAGDEINIYEVINSDTNDSGREKTKAMSGPNDEGNPVITTAGKQATITGSFPVQAGATKFYYVLGSPCMTMNGKATTIAFTLSANQEPKTMDALDDNADIFVSQIVESETQPTESVAFTTTRISSIAKVSIKVPTALAAGDAIKSVTFACDNKIAGKYSLNWDSVLAKTPLEGFTNNATGKSITVVLPTTQTADFSYYMGLWATTLAKDSKVTVTLNTQNEKKFIKEITLPSAMEFTTGNMTGLTVNMSAVAEYVEPEYPPIEGTVNVAGIYWATGNLEYDANGTASNGFAAGWRIAPSQYHHFHLGVEGEQTGTTDQMAHFNLGGITKFYQGGTDDSDAWITVAGTFDFSGKMYTDQTCTTPTNDYTDAKYGDIAYWASQGKYRMPTAAEMQKLYTDACYTLAKYSDGTNTIKGMYFYNPGAADTPGLVEGTKTIEDTDLAVGLFLPWSGRGYKDASNAKIFKINTNGVYRSATVSDKSTLDDPYGVIFRVMNTSESAYETDYVNAFYKAANQHDYGATARYAIRPVYIVK